MRHSMSHSMLKDFLDDDSQNEALESKDTVHNLLADPAFLTE